MSSVLKSPRQRGMTPSSDFSPRKRAKRGSSCLDCRRRKLKCDGRRPVCTRCIKGGLAVSCTYNASVPNETESEPSALVASAAQGEVPIAPVSCLRHDSHGEELNVSNIECSVTRREGVTSFATSAGDFVCSLGLANVQNAKFESLEQKIAHLTDLVVKLSSVRAEYALAKVRTEPELRQDDASQVPMDDSSTVAPSYSKGFRTNYWGPSNPMSITAEFDVLNYYTEGFLDRHPMLLRAIKDIKLHNKRRKEQIKAKESCAHVKSLHELLPAKEVIHPLISLYLDTVDNIYHVLHLPSFWKQYEHLWAHPLCQADTSIVVTVLLMSAAVMCVPEPDSVSFLGETTVNKDTAKSWVLCCEKWVQMQSEKYLTMTSFQHRCLLLIAKFMTGIKRKRWYYESAALVAFGMSIGLHLDRQRISWNKKVSEFDTEMRRRLWACIIELTFQATMHRGLPPALDRVAPETFPPLNLSDDQLEPTMISSSGVQLHLGFCPVSALIFRVDTRKMRMRILELVNRPNTNMLPAQFWDLEDQILRVKGTLSSWQSFALPSHLAPRRSFTSAHLELELKQLLLLLYRKASRDTQHLGLQRAGRMGCLDTCASIIKQHQGLTIPQSFIISSLFGDVMAAAMNLCYDLSTFNCDSHLSSTLERSHVIQLLDLVEYAVSAFALRLTHVGDVYRGYWILLSAQAIAKGKTFPDRAEAFNEDTAEKVANMIYKMLSLQAVPLGENIQVGASSENKSSPVELPSSQNFHQAQVPSTSIDALNSDELGLPSLELLSPPRWDWDSIFDM